MQRERLTPTRIDAFACPAGLYQAFLWDNVAPRLAVRATAGAKSFVFESKLDRKTIRITIGDVQAWPLESVWSGKGESRTEIQRGAREEAKRLQGLIDQGIDPRQEKADRLAQNEARKVAAESAERQAEESQKFTLRALCTAYETLLERNGKARSAAAVRSSFACHVLKPFPEIADKPAREVTPLQVAAMVRRVAEAGKDRSAGILRSYLSAAFNAARKAPFDAKLPADLIPFGVEHNPVEPVSTIAVKAGQRTLSADELKAYLAALTPALPDQALKLALLAGGQRMAQLLRATVADFDAEAETLRLWDAKGKRATPREHVLPLAPRAAELVTDLVKRAAAKGSPWLFSTHGKTAMTFTTPGKRVAELAASMRGEPFDLRDIRRTVETMLAGLGVSRDVRAQLLSHGLSGVQAAHYDRHTYAAEKRAALAAWETKLAAIEKGEKAPSNVRPLRQSRKGSAAA